MASCWCVLPRSIPSFRFPTRSSTAAAFSRLERKQMDGIVLPRSKSQVLRVWANANAPKGKRFSSGDVIMVDPLEAKRLAAKQMQEIQAKQKFKIVSLVSYMEIGGTDLQVPRLGLILFSYILLLIFDTDVFTSSQRQRQIEAINGAWAMIGLTAGLVIEGRTGESILGQLAGYWYVVVSFFSR